MTHVLINGLCVAPGGSLTVAREMAAALARERPDWRFTVALTRGRSEHAALARAVEGPNVTALWAPPSTSARLARPVFENLFLARWAGRHRVSAAIQLNGMMVPSLPAPTFSINGNPAPYRPELWTTRTGRLMAFLQRREHRRALRDSWFVGWTSGYVRGLVCGATGASPARSEVLYNGLPPSLAARLDRPFTDWASRPLEVLTVSSVLPYKRQQLVLEAVARLRQRPALAGLRYRVVGPCPSPEYLDALRGRARALGMPDALIVEGFVGDGVLEERMASARALAFMSICECFGLPPLEAMTFGTPSIVADCCSAREIYGDAVAYCPPDALEALTERLGRMLTDPAHAEDLRERGRQRARRFDWSDAAGRLTARIEESARSARVH